MALTTWLQTTNNAVTTLAVDLALAAVRIDLTSITTMPVAYPFRLTIWNAAVYGYTNPAADPDMEIVEVTAATPYGYYAAEYTITRGMEGTVDVAHSAGDTVALLITAGMIQQIQDAVTALETP